MFHWKDEAQHAVLDELELKRHDATLSSAERERAVGEFIDLVVAVDSILQGQARADAAYFGMNCGRPLQQGEPDLVARHFLKAYRWQYIFSGVQHLHFGRLLTSMTTPEQMARIQRALAPIMQG